MGDKNFWATDGDEINPANIKNICFRNDKVDEFFEYSNKHFIIATKGIGKTILLKGKRYQLEQEYRDKTKDNVDVKKTLFIPENNPYLDYIRNIGSLDRRMLAFLEDYKNAEKIWMLALQASIINYFIRLFHNKDIEKIKEDYKIHNNSKLSNILFSNRQIDPCEALAHILIENGIGRIQQEYDQMKIFSESIFNNYVRSGVFVFIDRIDQALEGNNEKLWVAMQAGLLEAAWNIMRSNNHVKIYTSIRLEAFYNYNSANKNALKGQATFLEYNYDDLFNLMNNLAFQYSKHNDGEASSNKDSFYKYIGIEKFTHPELGHEENVFKYILRHTICRPRDLTVIAGRYRKDNKFDVENFRQQINYIATGDIANILFNEYSVFLKSLKEEDNRNKLFAKIPRNILSYDELRNICREYNEKPSCKDERCITCQFSHPFCELYNIGLLGVVDEKRQHFLPPQEMSWAEKRHIKKSDYYLVHSCLNRIIKDQRNGDFEQVKWIPIGKYEGWNEKYTELIKLVITLNEISDIEMRKMVENEIFILLKEGKLNKDTLENKINPILRQGTGVINGAAKIIAILNNIIGIATGMGNVF